MASRRVYVDHLRHVPLFKGLSRKALERVAMAGQEVAVSAGTVLMEEGRAGRDAMVVLSGSIVVRRGDRKVATLGPGGVVGELALLDDGPRTATVVCASDARVLVLSAPEFRAVHDDVPALAKGLLSSMAERIRELDRTVLG